MLRHVGTAHRYPDSVKTITRVFSGRLSRSRGRAFDLPLMDFVAIAGGPREPLRTSPKDRLDRRFWESPEEIAPFENDRAVSLDPLSEQIRLTEGF
jgi:hypothetical protein